MRESETSACCLFVGRDLVCEEVPWRGGEGAARVDNTQPAPSSIHPSLVLSFSHPLPLPGPLTTLKTNNLDKHISDCKRGVLNLRARHAETFDDRGLSFRFFSFFPFRAWALVHPCLSSFALSLVQQNAGGPLLPRRLRRCGDVLGLYTAL